METPSKSETNHPQSSEQKEIVSVSSDSPAREPFSSVRPEMNAQTTFLIKYRRAVVILVHIGLWTLSFLGAMLLRFEFQIPGFYWKLIPAWLAIAIGLRLCIHYLFGMFHGIWRYTGTRDLLSLVKAGTLSSLALVFLVTFVGPKGLPRSVIIIDWLAAIGIVGGLRFGIRAIREVAAQATSSTPIKTKRILIVGAGDVGEMLLREIHRTHQRKFETIGMVDDDPSKHSAQIHGVPVLGPIELVPELVERHDIDEVIIAMPSAPAKLMRQIVEYCQKSKAQVRVVPGLDHVIEGRVTMNQLRNVAIDDLLRRDAVVLDTQSIAGFVAGKRVLITGAGGSIGSELCRQVCTFGPAQLILVEQAENALFHIHRELSRRFPDITLHPRIADICDSQRLEAVFRSDQPSVVFHAAAHKHVPMMESNPGEAIKNNVFGTKKVADLSHKYGVQKFVMISTDKAVNPTSIMGVSKRTAEIYIQTLAQQSSTDYITVRFGNVLGSNGSVIPIFKEQIANGGPVTVTHPEMTRYFMTIPEACQLVLQSAVLGSGGQIFVLDMGDPVRIVDLARDLVKLSGLIPGEDIEIKFTGIRPGEKLFEELSLDEERVDKTQHPKIFIGKLKPYAWEQVNAGLEGLHQVSNTGDVDTIRAEFRNLVPEYKPSSQKTKVVTEVASPREVEPEQTIMTAPPMDRPTPVASLPN
jgi:FlaA1/EpsC-like NDP-sugar epimerase